VIASSLASTVTSVLRLPLSQQYYTRVLSQRLCKLVVPRTRLETVADRFPSALRVAASSATLDSPSDFVNKSAISVFKKHLETYLFNQWTHQCKLPFPPCSFCLRHAKFIVFSRATQLTGRGTFAIDRPNVCLSVCHTSEWRLSSSRYRNMLGCFFVAVAVVDLLAAEWTAGCVMNTQQSNQEDASAIHSNLLFASSSST